MKVLTDFHHSGLYHSLRLLFEKRLGAILYRPIGEEWLNRGYWRMAELYNNHPATVRQYLGIESNFKFIEQGIYRVPDPAHETYQNAIKLDRFFREDFDIIIASIPQHIDSFAQLAKDHYSHPKVIYQIGNSWNLSINSPIRNIMASARLSRKVEGFNIIEYHQEFDLDIFQPGEQLDLFSQSKNIYSFINCFNTASIYQFDWIIFQQIEQLMPDWKFRSYGGSCRDGVANGDKEVAAKMHESKFIWHTKYDGDGYGHIVHNAAAVARPLITKLNYYLGKMGGELMIDGKTCIAIDGLSNEEIVKKIEYYSEPERYIQMCRDTYNNFKQVVNFDKEAELLKIFILNLIQ